MVDSRQTRKPTHRSRKEFTLHTNPTNHTQAILAKLSSGDPRPPMPRGVRYRTPAMTSTLSIGAWKLTSRTTATSPTQRGYLRVTIAHADQTLASYCLQDLTRQEASDELHTISTHLKAAIQLGEGEELMRKICPAEQPKRPYLPTGSGKNNNARHSDVTVIKPDGTTYTQAITLSSGRATKTRKPSLPAQDAIPVSPALAARIAKARRGN